MFIDKRVKEKLNKLPTFKNPYGPRDKKWNLRLKEEVTALIQIVKINKLNDQDWFFIKPKRIEWEGKCWFFHEHEKYEFLLRFEIPVTYPKTSIDFKLPELIGTTKKMYEGGSICQTIHFKPLWSKNEPKFGIVHGLMLGLAPWLAAEVPILIAQGKIGKK